MKPHSRDIDSSSVVLARIIGTVHTYIDLMSTIAKYQNNQNSFWDLVFNSLYDLVVIESYKLIDAKNLSVFSLIKQIKGVRPNDIVELDKDHGELKKLVDETDFRLIEHRHSQKAHTAKAINATLPRFADLSKIEELLNLCESLLRKYNGWIKGPKYSIDFSSIYAGGHKEMLDYVTRIIC